MGLGAPKKRSKLSHDPNNTAWTRDNTTFGHKILSKQGWKPGDFLGAENASHAAHFGAANASHIRVMLREDNLGLGAKIGGNTAETFGLSMFSGLLGRLNGDEMMQKKHEARVQAEEKADLARRFGFLNFVFGGTLKGDDLEMAEVEQPQVVAVKDVKSSTKKRNAGADEGEETEEAVNMKKKRKSEKRTRDDSEVEEKAAKKEKKRRQKADFASEAPASDEADSSSSAPSDEGKAKAEKRRRKAERKAEKDAKRSKSKTSDDEKARLKYENRARKEERRKRKEEKRRKRAEKHASTQPSAEASAVTSEAERSGTSTPTFMGGRQALRHRYIMQKRMAAGNAQALKEIFMLQPQAAS